MLERGSRILVEFSLKEFFFFFFLARSKIGPDNFSSSASKVLHHVKQNVQIPHITPLQESLQGSPGQYAWNHIGVTIQHELTSSFRNAQIFLLKNSTCILPTGGFQGSLLRSGLPVKGLRNQESHVQISDNGPSGGFSSASHLSSVNFRGLHTLSIQASKILLIQNTCSQ